MKRMQFTPAMAEAVMNGKTCTTRKVTNRINAGDQFAAVIGRTTPAKDGFAVCRCTGVFFLTPNEIASKYYKEEGFDEPEQYLAYWQSLNPDVPDDSTQKLICFQVEEVQNGKP